MKLFLKLSFCDETKIAPKNKSYHFGDNIKILFPKIIICDKNKIFPKIINLG